MVGGLFKAALPSRVLACLLGGACAALAAPDVTMIPDGEVRSLREALDRVRELRFAGHLGADRVAEVRVASGRYPVRAVTVVEPQDSHVRFVAAEPGGAIFDGGVELPPFTAGTDGVWRASVPDGLVFEQLYVNGKRAQRARSPNNFYFYMKAPWSTAYDPGLGLSANLDRRAFLAEPSDIAALAGLSEAALKRVEIKFWQSWDQAASKIDFVDAASGLVVSRTGTARTLFYWSTTRPRYALENFRAALDAPGEWFLDEDASELLYIPRAGETVAATRAVAPVAPEFVFFAGDPLTGQRIEDVTFEGLAFEHCAWTMPSAGALNAQSAQNIRTAGFIGDGVTRLTLKDCRIAHTGAHGVWLKRGCRHNAIVHCRLEDLGGGGVYLGDTAAWSAEEEGERCGFNVVSNSIIRSGGHVFNGAIGVWIGHGADNVIAHNDIGDFRYSGVSMGWTWGYGTTMNRRNQLLWNRIHHIGRGVLSDLGGVYTLGDSAGTVGLGNWIHDVDGYAGTGAPAWGLYTDEGSAGILYASNLVERCRDGSVHQHYGTNNRFENNLFVDFRQYGVWRTKSENRPSFEVRRNVFWWTNANARILSGARSLAVTNVVFEHNLYGGTTALGSSPFCGRTKAEWQQAGHDVYSRFEDPRFADPQHGDWTLAADSPARQLGFVPWDWTNAGVLKNDAAWRAAAMDDSDIEPLVDAPTAPAYTAPSEPDIPTPVYTPDTHRWRAAAANTPDTAYAWNAGANWTNGVPPDVCDGVEFPSGTSPLYVKLPDAITNGVLTCAANVCLLGEVFHLSNVNGARGSLQGSALRLYADLRYGTARDTTAPWITGVNLAGRLIAYACDPTPAAGVVSHRLDWFATSANPRRTDDIQLAYDRVYHPGSGSVSVYAPQGAAACEGFWTQTAGSPYLVRTSAAEHPLAVGTVVTGQGIPAGTFLRRRFGTDRIELSAPVTQSIAGNRLTFAAFTPDVRISIPAFSRQGCTTTDFKLYKSRAEDTLRFEMNAYATGANQVNRHGLTTQERLAYHPGTHVFHTVSGGGENARDEMMNCHFEFAGADYGHDTVYPASRPLGFAGAQYTARITVPEGMRATVMAFTNWTGTLVKDGGGRLTLRVTDVVNPGRLVLEEGAVTLVTAEEGAAVSLGGLDLRKGTRLVVPEGGLNVRDVVSEPGAVVTGRCRPLASVSFGEEALEPVGHPAFWVDASRTNTMDLTWQDGAWMLTRWRDCRAGEPMFCTNLVRRPQVSVGASRTEQYVRIGNVRSEYITNTEQLVWSVPIKGIRAVFLVQDPCEGGGEILGRCSWRLGNNYYGSRGGPYYRGGSLDWSKPLVSPSYATDCVKYGRFFIDGREVCGYETGYAGPFLQVVEHHVDETRRASASQAELVCDAFGTGYVDHPGDGTYVSGANGGLRIAECLVYTNALTHRERVQTLRYLSRKWLDREVNWSVTESDTDLTPVVLPAGGEEIRVPTGSALTAGGVSGSGDFVKTGGGVLYLESITNGDVTVAAGGLVVRSEDASLIPGGSWVHVDASDATSLEVTRSGSVDYVTKWRNLSNRAEYYRGYNGGQQDARLVAGAMNGLPLVDLGVSTARGGAFHALRYVREDGTSYPKLTNAPWASSPEFRTVFIVADSSGGGGSLLGADHHGYPSVGFPHVGSANFSAPMVGVGRSDLVWGIRPFSNEWAVGSAVFRRNGVDVNPFAEPFSGQGDVYAIRLDGTARRADALGVYGYSAAGAGLAYGEILIYPWSLPQRDFARVEAYLLRKWKNVRTDGFEPAAMRRLAMAEDGRTTVLGGALTVTTLLCRGTAMGTIALAAGGELQASVDAEGRMAALRVEGTLDLSAGGVVTVPPDLSYGTYTLATATTLVPGTLLVEDFPLYMSARVIVDQNHLKLLIEDTRCGTRILVR